MNISIIEIIAPSIIAPYCLTIGIIALLRIKKNNGKKECIAFLFLSLVTALWSLAPIINRFSRAYGYIAGILLINFALFYTLLITYKKLIKILIPFCISVSIIVILLMIKDKADPAIFTIKYVMILFPLSVILNIIIYRYYFKYKSKFHLSLGIMASLMIIGGFYQALMSSYAIPKIPATSFGAFGFTLIIGYHIIKKGYLQQYGWSDYLKELEQKENLLNERYLIQQKTTIDSIIVLSQTIEAKDPYTRGHCLRVRDFSKAIGEKLDFTKEELLYLEFGALLHDIGKIGIAGAILNKNGKLTDEEFEIIKKHPDIGADIIKNVDFYKPIIPLIRYHHEFYNGKGYPVGLKGKDIPIEARVLAVADTYDAMTSDRPYRKAFPKEKALTILKEVAGSQLDPVIVELFISEELYLISHYEDQKLRFKF